jgi:NTP pyrophosphatase (non-canonical NTP hydrolase)
MSKPTFEELQEKIVVWGAEKGILDASTTKEQLCKTVEELGELMGATIKGDQAGMRDGFGDTIVTLILAAEIAKIDLLTELENVYEIISKRKGAMVDGAFVKEVN